MTADSPSIPGAEPTVAWKVEALRPTLIDYLTAGLELHPDDARVSVEHLIRAEQAGKSSHGLIRVAYTTTSGKFGPYGGTPAPAPRQVAPGRLHVDGTGHFGYPLLQRLTESGCAAAKREGLCAVTTTRVYPSGALGDWARLASREGVGMILMANSPRRVAALGGTRPIAGTNAICIGIPTDPLPFVADCATSEISHGVLLLARASGAALPPNSAIGPDGRPTTSAAEVDPTKGLGALLPFGGSYKAFAISLGIELLACLGGGTPGEVQAGRHGVFCLFLGPDLLRGRLPALSEWLRALDAGGTRIPGWTSGRRAREQQGRGVVEVPKKTMDSLVALGVFPAGADGASPTDAGG